MPKISILIPVYNVEKYLRECLDSVLKQTLEDIEIICIDDGSRDSSGAVLDEYAKKDSLVRVLHKTNTGYGHSMNYGLQHATGEYIGIVEPDDFIPPNMYEELYRVAGTHDVDCVKSDFYRVSTAPEGNYKFEEVALYPSDSGFYGRVISPIAEPKVMNSATLATWTGIYRRSFLQEFQIQYHESPGASFQDVGFFIQTMALARSCFFLKGCFYCYRVDNPNSSIADRKKIFAFSEEYVFAEKKLSGYETVQSVFFPHVLARKFSGLLFSCRRVDQAYKLLLLYTIYREFLPHYENGTLNKDLFLPGEWDKLLIILQAPEFLYFKEFWSSKRLTAPYEEENLKLRKELESVYRSFSYRLGRLVTWLPRKIRTRLR